MAQRKLEQMSKLKAALGLKEDVREGDAFNRELQVRRRCWVVLGGGSRPCKTECLLLDGPRQRRWGRMRC